MNATRPADAGGSLGLFEPRASQDGTCLFPSLTIGPTQPPSVRRLSRCGASSFETRAWRVYSVCLFLAASLVVCIGCQPRPVASVQLIAGQTMGTTYAVKLVPNEAMLDLSEISAEVQAELDRVNQQMSTYDPTSELSRFNALTSSDWFEVSAETAAVAKLAQQIFEQSEGAFDVTVGPLVNLWGFGPDGRPEEVPSQAQVDTLLASTGSTRFEVRLEPPALRKLHPKLQLDFSAIAKGHGVDRLASVLDRLSVQAYFIEVGGEIRTRGMRLDGSPWQVGIERPLENTREIQQVIGLSNQSLATSGNYRNVYELDGQRFSHTINPTTGRPVEDAIASASAIADNCALADAIATSMMSSGFKRGLEIAEQNHWAVLLVRKTAEDGFETAASDAFDLMFPDRKTAGENAAGENAEMELRP